MGAILTQRSESIKHTWVLLNTFYTNRVSNNKDLVKEIRACKNHKKLTVSTNGGLNSLDKKVTLKLFPMNVHFNQNSMSNILSFKEVADIPGVRITTETNQERAMTVTLKNGFF